MSNVFGFLFAGLILFSCCWFGQWSVDAAKSRVTANSSAQYNDLVIAIHDAIPQSDQLISSIKTQFRKASLFLRQATHKYRNGLTFGKIYILVPSSWRNVPDLYQDSGWQTFDDADVRVAPANPEYGNRPYTEQSRGCGEPGVYTHYTDQYFLEESKSIFDYGKYERAIVHEWAHYRWGIFDEYPTKGYPQYYTQNGLIYPTRCTKKIRGIFINTKTDGPCIINTETNKPEDECEFFPSSSETVSPASLMYAPTIEAVTEFCDSGEGSTMHNSNAPNKHNEMCNRQSVWDVMRRHADFKQDYPRAGDEKDPDFILLQRRDNPVKLVFVLDVSGSMRGAPIAKLKEATILILNLIDDDIQIGLVSFSTSVDRLQELNRFSDDSVRESYINTTRGIREGGLTAIGDGLIEGFKMLGGQVTNPAAYKEKSYIVLITDGQENTGIINLTAAARIISQSDVVVTALSIGPSADNRLKDLTSATGGDYFYSDPSSFSLDLRENLIRSLKMSASPKSQVILVASSKVSLPENSQIPVWSGWLDRSLGRDTVFSMQFETSLQHLRVLSPTGRVFNQALGPAVYKTDDEFRTITIQIPGQAESGNWTLYLDAPSTVKRRFRRATQEALLTVGSKQTNDTASTDTGLQIESTLDINSLPVVNRQTRVPIYVSVGLNGRPVLDAQVVLALRPPQGSGTSDKLLSLRDNGVGTDTTANDGIYSLSIIGQDITQAGFYNLHVALFKDSGNTNSSETFQRQVPVGAILVREVENSTPDRSPPDSIRGVHISIVNAEQRSVRLHWLAVGDDGDRGTAQTYEFDVFQYADNSSHEIPLNYNVSGVLNTTTSITAKPPGESEQFIVTLAIHNNITLDDTVSYSVRAVDAANNKGDWSLPVSVAFTKPVFGAPVKQGGEEHKPRKDDTSGIPVTILSLSLVAVIFGLGLCVGVAVLLRRRFSIQHSV